MRRTLLATAILCAWPVFAHAQNIRSGTIGGMPYQVLMPATACTASNPCGVVVYLGYQDASYQDATTALQNYFAGDTLLHAIVIAPTITASQDYNTNWGGYAQINTPQQQQMVAVVQGVEAQMGNMVDPANSAVTGGSLGGDGTQAALIAYGPKGTVQPGVFSSGVSFDAATYAAAGNAQDIAALCGVPLMAVHGTADTNQSVTYDQNLQAAIDGNPACNNSFTFVPVQGAGHGTWGGPAGYNAGTGPGTPLGTIAADLSMSPPTTGSVAAAPPPAASTTPPASTTTPTAAGGGTSKPTTTAAASSNGTVKINLSAPVSMSGGNNSLLVGFPWGGGNQQTLAGNGEGEVYEASGIKQNADGSITLAAQPNSNTSAAWPNNLPYTSGGFSTASVNNGMPQAGGFSALYGYFQMTATLPTGAGLWPAFWLEPVNGTSACEIDIFEAPFNNPTLIQDSLHDGGTGYTTGQVTVPNYSSNANTYGGNWSPTTITYYVNGQEVGSTPTPASCNTPAYILANLAVGGQSWAWPGTPNSSNNWPATMNIQSITYNPNGPGGVGSDGGTFTGGLAVGGASAGTSPGQAGGTSTTSQPLATTPGVTKPATSSPATGTPPQITPSNGSVTDCSGNTWAITGDSRIEENGVLVQGGGDTSALAISGCTVYGLSNGENGSKTGWFTMSTVDQAGDQFWNFIGAAPASWSNVAPAPANPTPSTIPPVAVSTPAPVKPATGPIALKQAAQYSCTSAPPNSNPSNGGFATINGVLDQPDGTPFVARGIDIHDFDLNAAAASLPQLFPGINMVRVAIESLSDNPADYASAVSALTAQGIVVEFSDYTNTTGQNVGGGAGSVYTGSTLAQENAMYSAFASYYKNNPYIWLGTDNEPATSGGSLSDWQLSNYQAIRATGFSAPILLDPSGSRPPGYGGTPEMSGLNPADYAQMENIVWDPHVYPYQDNSSTDQGTANALVQATIQAMQTIQGVDGPPPVIIGEYGPAVGMGDGADQATIAAVQANQTMGGSGATAWAYDTSAQLNLTSGSGLTAWGQSVANYTSASGSKGCNISPDPSVVATTATVTPSAADMAAITAASASLQPPATTAKQ